jgi:hypothetical protein
MGSQLSLKLRDQGITAFIRVQLILEGIEIHFLLQNVGIEDKVCDHRPRFVQKVIVDRADI